MIMVIKKYHFIPLLIFLLYFAHYKYDKSALPDWTSIMKINIDFNSSMIQNSDHTIRKSYNETFKIKTNHKPYQVCHNCSEYPPSVILWSTWRSGSTLLGELLEGAHQDTFYDYEPMWPLGVKIFRDNNTETQKAIKYLNSVLRCDMNSYQELSLKLTKPIAWKKNNYLRNKCIEYDTVCGNASMLSNICKSAKYHSVKLLRLGLVWAQSLLSDPTLDTRIIYLVRDPRATMRSRSHLGWCSNSSEDCSNPVQVCHHIHQDLLDAKKLRVTYQNRFYFLRYEDLSLDVLGTVENLWKHLGYSLTNAQREKLISLTSDNGNISNSYRVNRDSVSHTFSWRSSMKYEDMVYVQRACSDVLKMLGFRSFYNKEDYQNHSLSVLTKAPEDVFE